jgi:hypothetical protein
VPSLPDAGKPERAMSDAVGCPLPNIAERGARRRRNGGIAWAIIGAIAAVVLVARHLPATALLVLAFPFALAALGFLQARERT